MTSKRQPPEEKKYSVSVSLNGETHTCQTDDLKEAIAALNPKVFKTKVVIKVANKFGGVERVLMIQKAKQLFRINMVMDVFVKNILLGLKHG